MAKRSVKRTVKKAARKTKPRVSCLTIASVVLLFTVVFTGMMSAVVVVGVLKFIKEMPPMMEGPLPAQKKTTKIFSSDGALLANLYYIENRDYARLNEIPVKFQLAVIATEDERFFMHPGVDIVGIFRAITVNMKAGRTVEGASTLSQQLAKNTFLTSERTYVRKIREMQYALALERKYSKEEILEFYLNQNNFGHGAHGVKTAARTYYGKELKDLTLAESALLAGVPKAPGRYSPYYNMEKSVRRRDQILGKMVRLGFISDSEYRQAAAEQVKLSPLSGPGYENYKAPNFVTYLIDVLTDPSGPFQISSQNLHTQGYRIYTTLNYKMQKDAEATVAEGMRMARERRANMTQAALVALDTKTGRILAMVGGVDYKKSKFNRAVQALRQPGSSFKPLVYLTAINEGYSMASSVSDSPVCYPSYPKAYCPRNYDGRFMGGMAFHRALVLSRNVPAVKVCKMVGSDNVVKTAKSMGITSNLQSNLSLALGSGDVTVLEMAAAYSVMGNGGYAIPPVSIERITDDSGTIVYEHKSKKGKRALDDNAIARIVPVLEDVIKSGTGRGANIGRPAAGKTGTTSDYRDAWFIGFTPQITTAVWVGNDNNSPLRGLVRGQPVGAGIAGGTIPAPMWKFFMDRALKGTEVAEFNLPEPGEAKNGRVSGGGGESATGTHQARVGRTIDQLEPEMLDFTEEDRRQLAPKPEIDNAYDELEFIEEDDQREVEDLF